MSRTKVCERCKFFKPRQGKGFMAECRRKPPTVNIQGTTVFPEVKPSLWCGEFEVNLEKYHTDGKKIYTRIDTNRVVGPGYTNAESGGIYGR